MAQIDTQAIIDALTLKLRTEYPDAVIDNEEAPQGIRPGAILVNLTNAGQSQLNPHRFHRTPQFDVLYFRITATPSAPPWQITFARCWTPSPHRAGIFCTAAA